MYFKNLGDVQSPGKKIFLHVVRVALRTLYNSISSFSEGINYEMFIIPCSCFVKGHSRAFHANLESSTTDSAIKAKSSACWNQTTLHLLQRSVFADNAKLLLGLFTTAYCDCYNTFGVPFQTIFVQNWVRNDTFIFFKCIRARVWERNRQVKTFLQVWQFFQAELLLQLYCKTLSKWADWNFRNESQCCVARYFSMNIFY